MNMEPTFFFEKEMKRKKDLTVVHEKAEKEGKMVSKADSESTWYGFEVQQVVMQCLVITPSNTARQARTSFFKPPC